MIACSETVCQTDIFGLTNHTETDGKTDRLIYGTRLAYENIDHLLSVRGTRWFIEYYF